MKTSRKISIVIIPISVLGIIFTGSFLFQYFVTIPTENQDDLNFKMTPFDMSDLSSPVIGSLDASVTIIAFNDYHCPSCKSWFENEYSEISVKLIETKQANIIFVDSIPTGSDSFLIS